MSQHPNADGSITGGVKVEARGKFVSHQLGLVATAVVSPTVPAGRNEAVRGAGHVLPCGMYSPDKLIWPPATRSTR